MCENSRENVLFYTSVLGKFINWFVHSLTGAPGIKAAYFFWCKGVNLLKCFDIKKNCLSLSWKEHVSAFQIPHH